ncbi:CBR1 [Mytilus edulis]|uniref:carbonyl reductase (NADPH) n=1 Tax=Mytilus edulis TaxID=6550 RepID=A0A8S3RP04_MYTED|nr:CBR1 [Mytilus edulis]
MVTGANKGIGYAVVQALCKQFDGDVLLTGKANKVIGYAVVQALCKQFDGDVLLTGKANKGIGYAVVQALCKQFDGDVLLTGKTNKGIGYAVVQALCKQFDGDVLLTGRSEERCKAAVAELQKQGMSPKYHQMDLDDQTSINKLRDFVKEQYGGIDVLVNNAGIAFKAASTAPFSEQATVSCATNFYGTLNVCNTLFPLLRPHARVSNVSSMASQMSIAKCSNAIKAKFKDPKITMDQLKALIQQFIDAAQTDSHQKQGFASSAYGMSKVGVTVMSFIQQRELNSDPREDIVVNACCPGYVDTDMSSHKGPKTIEQGADTPVYLAMLPSGTTSPKGNYLSDRTIKNWG